MTRYIPCFLHTPPPVAAALTAVVLTALALAVPTQASANPGRTAAHCVSISRSSSLYSDTMRARNTCGHSVFVIYCGGTPNCRNSVYYSHSFILRAGAAHAFGLRNGGRLRGGACEGTFGFGNEGHFRDARNGDYGCLRR